MLRVLLGFWEQVMRNVNVLILLVLAGMGPAIVSAAERDSRAQYGTRSLQAAKHIAATINLSRQKKNLEALKEAQSAIAADPSCQMAHYWHAIVLMDLGRIDQAKAKYEHVYKLGDTHQADNLTVEVAVDLGLIHGRLKEYDKSSIWFTRAIVCDPHDKHGYRWKAFRNLSINMLNTRRNMSAALAVIFAYAANPNKVSDKMVTELLERAGDDEVARVLYFGVKTPKLAPRSVEKLGQMTSVEVKQDALAENIHGFHPDPQGRYVVATVSSAPHYYLIKTTGSLSLKQVKVKSKIQAAHLVGQRLYLVLSDPGRLETVDPLTGKTSASVSLGDMSPKTIAVVPSHSTAYFPIKKEIRRLDMSTGRTFSTDVPGQHVAAGPNQRFIFSYVKPDYQHPQHIIINGRPVFIRSTRTDWTQSTLFKSLVVPGGLQLAEVRENAASNAYRIVISGDGHWVALVGGGGWRPRADKDKGHGYGVAVFGGHNFEHIQGFYRSASHSAGAAINPVTGQIVTLARNQANIYHLADPSKSQTVKGAFNGICTWSGGGNYLLLAGKQKKNDTVQRLFVYANPMSMKEKQLAGQWWRKLNVAAAKQASPAKKVDMKPVGWLASFAIRTTRTDARRMLSRVAKDARTDRPHQWRHHKPYVEKNPKLPGQISDIWKQTPRVQDAGMAVYLFRKLLKANPNSTPVKFSMAQALAGTGQRTEAGTLLLQVVRTDAGRTILTCLALSDLGGILLQQNKEMAAIYCLAASAWTDKANPKTIERLAALLQKNGFKTEAARFSAGQPSVAVSSGTLGKLPAPSGRSRKLTATLIHSKSVQSVVLIKVGRGTGTGVCIGKSGLILTNHHVVDSRSNIFVYPFRLKNGKAQRLRSYVGRVVYSDPRGDIAVLKISTPPSSLRPLPVALADPKPGQSVFAIGHPGLGDKVPTQTISQGIISSGARTLEGVRYLQHTAAINPGNSGGPLLDDRGRLVGLNTLKAKLQGVNFSIPVETIRAVFAGGKR